MFCYRMCDKQINKNMTDNCSEVVWKITLSMFIPDDYCVVNRNMSWVKQLG
jgi:hypothetical protein